MRKTRALREMPVKVKYARTVLGLGACHYPLPCLVLRSYSISLHLPPANTIPHQFPLHISFPTVPFSSPLPVRCNLRFFSVLVHSFCVVHHASQGSTISIPILCTSPIKFVPATLKRLLSRPFYCTLYSLALTTRSYVSSCIQSLSLWD